MPRFHRCSSARARRHSGPAPAAAPHRRVLACLLALLLCASCATPTEPKAKPKPKGEPETIDLSVYRRADAARITLLEEEVLRLRADLRRAEEALIAVESGLRGTHTRADAVSSLAESRILVERAASEAPWRVDELEDARQKLDEADRQILQGNPGAALFFVYRAQRIAELARLEAREIRDRSEASFVTVQGVNLRSGPSIDDPIIAVLREGTPLFVERRAKRWLLVRTTLGSVGWIHGALVSSR